MSVATYGAAKTKSVPAKAKIPAVKRTRAPAKSALAATPIDETPMFVSVTPAYARSYERKTSRIPLIAGGVAAVAAIALIAGTSRTARDTETTPTPVAAAPSTTNALAVNTPAPVPPASVGAQPGAQLIAPAPAPAIRSQASLAPRVATPSPNPFDADRAAVDASATVPAAPAAPEPLAIPPVQAAPEVEAVPAPAPQAPAAPEAALTPGSTAADGNVSHLARDLTVPV